ncbi:branched-chain amino acid ABC transporter permease [Skermanella aerolata]|uniref:Branched-chain amino acid ABC transporter permease n=1 Tax=Skermanella aerolata TaxID=393310 RepID=A0A512E1G2_9PROT|nr:branched-chain amino acid ABC transporter permease [Skermanella aerolata]KJB90371.1 branched-chain amino acid ABC transporter [Skermanella aerolata KACC 11604]GEO42549.1 branched-chain amino acid ABC transporter permease [Skermanella aerolata]
MSELVLQSLYAGLLAGGYYALIALGLTLIFGTMKVINLAHGEMVLLAAYIAYTAESVYGINPVLAIPLAVAAVVLTSVMVYGLVSRIRQDRELNSLILTFGIGIVLTNFVLMVWSADIRSTNVPWFNEPVVIGEAFYSTSAQVLFFLAGLGLTAALWWWLGRSWYGRALRAVASNRNAAMLMGVNPRTTEVISFVIAGLLAGIAGVALYTVAVIHPDLGHNLTIKAFVITVLAGLGSIPGVLVGAMLIGVAEYMTITLASSALQELTGMVMFLLVLFIRPSGLFGSRGRVG